MLSGDAPRGANVNFRCFKQPGHRAESCVVGSQTEFEVASEVGRTGITGL